VTRAELLVGITRRLTQAGVESPHREARLILARGLGLGAAPLIAEPEARLSSAAVCKAEALARRRAAREPFSRILATREFWSLEITIDPSVLDPRPASETLVEAGLAKVAAMGGLSRVLDLGTGSGCLLLALLSELPGATGLGTDISYDALTLAKRNACALGLARRAFFVQADWLTGIAGGWDLVLANPPYVERGAIAHLEPEVRHYDPSIALDGGADGLDHYRAIVPGLRQALRPGGVVAMEVGAGQADQVAAMLRAVGLDEVETARDLQGICRCVVARKPRKIRPWGKKTVGKGTKPL